MPVTPTGAPQQPAPPTPPNSQNGPSNPYNPFTYTYAAGIGGAPTAPAPTVIGVPPSTTYNLQVSSPRQLLSMQWVNGELVVKFTGEESGQYLSLELAPERNISPFEQLQVSLLITACMNKVIGSTTAIMQYVRLHQLERHFKITVTA